MTRLEKLYINNNKLTALRRIKLQNVPSLKELFIKDNVVDKIENLELLTLQELKK